MTSAAPELTPLAERLLDEALIDAVRTSRPFLADFLALIPQSGRALGEFALSAVERSVKHGTGGNVGETDVMLSLSGANRERLTLLVENKVTAAFRPRQAERYAERAELMKAKNVEVTTVLIAPERYLSNPNPQVQYFDARISVEVLSATAGRHESVPLRVRTLLRALAVRAADGRPLGAKGLFPELHGMLHDELLRRGSMIRISNRPTDWVFLRHPSLPNGSLLRYRIREGVAELRFRGKSVSAIQALLAVSAVERKPIIRGIELCFQDHLIVSAAARKGAVTEGDIDVIATALEQLVTWFRETVTAS